MTSCPSCYADVKAEDAVCHSRRFHSTVPLFVCGDCDLRSLCFSDALVHSLLHGHALRSGENTRQAAIMEHWNGSFCNNDVDGVTEYNSQPGLALQPRLHRSFPVETFESTETNVPTEYNERLRTFALSPQKTETTIFHSSRTAKLTTPSPVISGSISTQITVSNSSTSRKTMRNSSLRLSRPNTPLSPSNRKSFNDPTCSQCNKTVQIGNSLSSKTVQHVLHCQDIKPFICSTCTASFNKKGHADRHIKNGRECAGSEVRMPYKQEDENRIRIGLQICFPRFRISWSGFR